MKKGEFINISKRMVKEYFNRYVDKENTIKRRHVLIHECTEYNNTYSVILKILGRDKTFYGVTYHKDTNEFDSYIYKSINDKVIIGKVIDMKGE